MTLQEKLRKRAEADLGLEISFQPGGSAAVLHQASTRPESFDLYEQWSNSIRVLWQAGAIQPIETERLTYWGEINELTKEGRLYEIDTRLRPSGADSSLATYLEAFDQYFKGMAWVFEFMALTRSRVVYSSSDKLKDSLEGIVTEHLSRKHNHNELVDEVQRMREKIAEQYRTDNPWYIKHVRGGLVDLDFIAQFLLLKYAHDIPEMIQSNSARVFEVAQQHKILDDAIATQLIEAHGFLSNMLSFLRLTSPTEIIEKSTPRGLKNLLAERFGIKPFNKLEEKLINTEAFVLEQYEKLDAL